MFHASYLFMDRNGSLAHFIFHDIFKSPSIQFTEKFFFPTPLDKKLLHRDGGKLLLRNSVHADTVSQE